MNCLVGKERSCFRFQRLGDWCSVGRTRARGDVAASRRAVAATCGWGWGRVWRGACEPVGGRWGCDVGAVTVGSFFYQHKPMAFSKNI